MHISANLPSSPRDLSRCRNRPTLSWICPCPFSLSFPPLLPLRRQWKAWLRWLESLPILQTWQLHELSRPRSLIYVQLAQQVP